MSTYWKHLIWLCCVFVFLLFPLPTFAETPPVLLYQANAQTYDWTISDFFTGTKTYTNNKNPFNFEVYACPDMPASNTRNDCIPTSQSSGGYKWWSSSSFHNGNPCTVLQASFDGPKINADTRVNSTGKTNANTPKICTDNSGSFPIQSTVPFLTITKQFDYDASYCAGTQRIVLAPRSDPYAAVCSSFTVNSLTANPKNYSQDQRNCMMFVDDRIDFKACKGSTCKTHTYQPTDGTESFAKPDDKYQNVCDAFTAGSGTYTITINMWDIFGSQYANSSFWLTFLQTPPTYTINGNIFVDANKNGVKDSGESNYTGAITITSSAGTISTSNGTYTINNIDPGSDTIQYTSLPSGYTPTAPVNGPPPTHQVTVGGSCSTNGALGASCAAGNISNLNFGITNSIPWMQTYDADVRFDNGLDNPIPASSVYPLYALAFTSSSTTPGILFSGDSTVSMGQGNTSSTNWLAGGTIYPEVYSPSSGTLRTSYQNLVSNATGAGITPTNLTSFSTCANLTNCTLPANLPSGIYRGNGNVTLNTFTAPINNNYVFLINGTLTINGNIIIPNSSTALFSAAQDILVPQTIGLAATSPLPTPQLQGWYVSGRNFIVQGINNCTTGADRMLNMAGAVIVNANGTGGNFSNQRDLCGGNLNYPTFTIQARPDFILRAPTFLMKQNSSFLEVAP